MCYAALLRYSRTYCWTDTCVMRFWSGLAYSCSVSFHSMMIYFFKFKIGSSPKAL